MAYKWNNPEAIETDITHDIQLSPYSDWWFTNLSIPKLVDELHQFPSPIGPLDVAPFKNGAMCDRTIPAGIPKVDAANTDNVIVGIIDQVDIKIPGDAADSR